MANYSDVKASGAVVKSYANLAAFPSSGNSAGDLALASDTGGIYVWDGSEWDRIASGADELPEFTTEPAASYELESDGTVTTITVAATDPEGFPITYSHDTVPSNQAQATITNSGGTFTVTPTTNTANAGTFSLRFKASDGVNVSSKTSTLSLAFATNEVDISPALNGATTLNRSDGNIAGFTPGTVYTLTNNGTQAIVFDWTLKGAGGGGTGNNSGGAGGETTGRWSLAGGGGTVNLIVGNTGTSSTATNHGAGGGGGTGLYTGTLGSDTPILVAGGGGGASWNAAISTFGQGGGSSGTGGSTANQSSGAGAGTQSAAGAGASGSRGSGSAGSGHNGGDSAGNSTEYAGGTGYGNGGDGHHQGGDGGAGGGGGGYYGGGGGAIGNYGAGSTGGGGSGYIGGSGVSNGVTTAGSGSASATNGSITIAWVA